MNLAQHIVDALLESTNDEQDAENIWNGASVTSRMTWMDNAGVRDYTQADIGLWNTLSGSHQNQILRYYRAIGIVPDLP